MGEQAIFPTYSNIDFTSYTDFSKCVDGYHIMVPGKYRISMRFKGGSKIFECLINDSIVLAINIPYWQTNELSDSIDIDINKGDVLKLRYKMTEGTGYSYIGLAYCSVSPLF